jgi:polysaccharide export outer membrane protein
LFLYICEDNLLLRMRKVFFVVLSLTIILLLSSCFRYKEIVYFNKTGLDSIYNPKFDAFKIKTGDLLYFSVYSINDEIVKMFNEDSRFVNYSFNDQALYLLGYLVDEEGDINLPFVGKVKVAGLTLDSAQTLISSKIQEYFNDVNVKVKFLSYNVSLLGEVKHPGRFKIIGKRLSIFEALAMAGDMTDYADRTHVVLIRENADGSVTTKTVNLLKDDVLQSDVFYLYPNDVVYVQPLKSKNFRLNSPSISILLSTLTTLILVLNFIIKR